MFIDYTIFSTLYLYIYSPVDIGEHSEELLLLSEIEELKNFLGISEESVLKTVKDLIQTHAWIQNEQICDVIKKPLMRLCARYLHREKRRGFALNPVGM